MSDNPLLFKSAGIGSLLNVSTGQTYLTPFGSVYGAGATNLLSATSAGSTGSLLAGGGLSSAPSFISLPGNTLALKAPTIQSFTGATTSGIYALPLSPAPLYLVIEAAGGGGGGGGSGTGSGAGGNGLTTAFGTTLLVLSGGGGSGSNVGGTFVINSPAVQIVAINGPSGGLGASSGGVGGSGGGTPFGGAGTITTGVGKSASPGSGSGGSGAGIAAGGIEGGGGSAGAYAKILVPNPVSIGSTFSYLVGGGGNGGTAGTGSVGGTGAVGAITITEHYQ